MSNKKPVVLLLFTAALIVVLCVVALGGASIWQWRNLTAVSTAPTPTAPGTQIVPTPAVPPTSQPLPSAPPLTSIPALPPASVVPTPSAGDGGQASPLQLSTEELLLQADIPPRDQRLLAMRLKNNGQEIPAVVRDVPPTYALGDTDTFWVTDNQQTPPRQFQVSAVLKFITPHSYWWVQDGFEVDIEDLQRSASRFENYTYPTNREFFGTEWTPGVDNDPRVHIFMGDVPGVAGYYSASNEYSRLAEPYSNQREMFFINLRAMRPGVDYFDSVLAHEFQHMIHWYQDRNEDTWVNEGLSELATFLNGYGASNFVGAYAVEPDTQLNSWADTPDQALANYGGSFLFMAYFLQRFGEELTRAVVSHPENGIAGFNIVLAENGYAERFDDIFADFLIANYLNDPTIDDGRWGYIDLRPSPAQPVEAYHAYPVEQQATVHQYAADYIELTGDSDLVIEFFGSTEVPVVNTTPHSGSYLWYSLRGDDSNSRLTRGVDLRSVSAATLTYWTWFDIEEDWDYGYVEVSTDGGRTWTILQTPNSAIDNPSGNAYGPGYTGISGNGDTPEWIQEEVDLSAYTGQEVLLRFEYVTDDAVNRPGWVIDDIRIPEIGFEDDAELPVDGWQAEGFVRIDNTLRQKFLVQVLELGDEVRVQRMTLDADNRGQLTIQGLGKSVEQAVLIVSGLTPVTTEPARYEYRISPAP